MKFRSLKSGLPAGMLVAALLLVGALSCKHDKDDVINNPPPASVPALQLVAEGLTSPLSVVEAPDDSKRLFILDQAGTIWIVPQGAPRLSTPFLNLSSRIAPLTAAYDERGLLSLAFHPSFRTNGRFYVFYTAPPRAGGPAPGVAWNNLTRVSEFRVSATDPNVADASSERIILEADHPQFNHNGGTIAFGPDGYLYISIGDGGNKDDVGPGHLPDWYAINAGGNAQNLTVILGKLLRIDVNSGTPYSIPPDNPYAGSATARKEIWAFGFRNPYRFSFDMGGSRQLLLGDAGQSLWEEINLVTRGGNYGWNVREGKICFNTDSDLLVRPSCPSADSAGNPLIDPVIQIQNLANPGVSGGITVVVGGNVYRGNALPGLQGRYIFGSFSSNFTNPDGRLYVATPAAAGAWTYEALTPKDYPSNLGYFLKGFGQDLSGEMYIAVSTSLGPSGASGKVFRLVAP
jgi:glucose/arabinose dehydrogenase